MDIIQLQETITFNHKGIEIYLNLDYEKETVSFIEKNGQPKKWLFTDRGEEYLGGWYLILEAMQEATKYADTRLKDQAKARQDRKVDKITNIAIALNKRKGLRGSRV